jgi:Leucine-rich repeat (LRR) protein
METFDDKIHERADELDLSHKGWIVVDNKVWDAGARIRKLNLAHNRLVDFPRAVGLLYMLETLDISHNEIIRIPVELGKCTRLKKLDCSHNHIEELPLEMSNCTRLEELNVAHNRLQEVPAFVATALRHLHKLDLQDNRLVRLPLEFGEAEQLHDMNVMENEGLTTVHPAARSNAKLIKWSCGLEKRYRDERDELLTHNEAMEELNRKYEVERQRLAEEILRLTRELAELENYTAYYRAIKRRSNGLCAIM